MTTQVLPPRWALQPFEADLAHREAEAIAGVPGQWTGEALALLGDVDSSTIQALVDRLGFARALSIGDAEIPTVQAALEASAGGGGRKVTSHALHGLHPYKGKFYPQLARSLLNVCGVPTGGLVLDPFAGCGTTILEAGLLGIRGVGLDANPLATLVSETKVRLLSYPVAKLSEQLTQLHQLTGRARVLPDQDYLARWLPPANLAFLRRIVPAIEGLSDTVARDAAKVVLSSVIRRASFQEPSQLRVYRRKPGQDPEPLQSLFAEALASVIRDLTAVQSVAGIAWRRIAELGSTIVHGDSRQLRATLHGLGVMQVDAVITSPPYANALPYVDTDRLSLRAFGLLGGMSQRAAEQALIGNREVGDRELRCLTEEMDAELSGESWMPEQLRSVLMASRCAATEPEAGFRRRRTPGLLYTYFRDMRRVMVDVAALVRPGGPVAIVIGDNTVTGPEGTSLVIPTADIIRHIAQDVGMEVQADLSKRLTSFGASTTVHQRNAMESERVLLFRTSRA